MLCNEKYYHTQNTKYLWVMLFILQVYLLLAHSAYASVSPIILLASTGRGHLPSVVFMGETELL